ncbi:uncharacterized protein MELLADRAFT_107023 [Melampsora larici-populina 98AG31]|uniref:Zn(2)-C6 fungal-type domain-containing protein n=1 Tax=Melampsora larici-populina (strain 98AG31 / pathotype 3-4-7) TaxID=747676 RepID=F4RNE9_MELLP|nr:uncharacterized protein MELLADRAFT_107023 [Melampsora larici-populina 98AG31]EGG06109.1 hypothetical protein MELLADRAFT_107023 [Melampsora larici-populina 98AG31]
MSPPHRASPLVPDSSTHEQQISNPTYHPPFQNSHHRHPDAAQSTRSPTESQSRSAVLYVQSSPSLQLSPTLSPLPSTSTAAHPFPVVDRSHKRIKGPVARSAAACNLCRSQKMKCEGPNHAPCRRCVRNNVDCVFGESQGRARQILWSKRTEELEMKVMKHEEELKQAMAMIAKLQQYTSYCKAIRAAKPGPRRSDLVDRGKLSEQKAEELFEIITSGRDPQWESSKRLGATDTMAESSELICEDIRVTQFDLKIANQPDSFDNVRCSTGAKGKRDVVSYRIAKSNVIELVIDVLCYRYFPHDQPQSYQDVIAIIGCIVHCGLGLDPALVVDYAEHLRLRDVFDRLPEERWQGESDQRQLLSIARTFIGVYIHTVLFSDSNWDGNLKYFVGYYALMEEAQIKLDSHYRLGAIDVTDRIVHIERYSALVSSWKMDWESELKRKGDSVSSDAVIEFELMYHRVSSTLRREKSPDLCSGLSSLRVKQGMTYLACFATAGSRNGREIFSDPRRLRLARQGVNHGIAILNQFIDSRLAQPDVPCVHVIKDLTDELRKEGDEWGGGTEDSYVTTLQKLSSQLDEVQAKRTERRSTEGSRGTDDGSESFLETKTPIQPQINLSEATATSTSEMPMPKIVMPEDQMNPPTESIGVTHSAIKVENVTHPTLPVAVRPSNESIHGNNAVTSGWLVDTANYTANQYGHQSQEMIDHEMGGQAMMTSSPTTALMYEPLGSAPPWNLHDPSSPVLHFSPTSPSFDHITQLHQSNGTTNPAVYDTHGFQTHPNLSDHFQPQTSDNHHQFQYQHQPNFDGLQQPTFVVAEQTREMLQSLRTVYSDRVEQSCFQTSS